MSTVRNTSFSVHVENCYASGKAKRPRGPRSSFARPVLNLDLETRALAYYLQYHLHIAIDEPNAAGGWSECISEWRASGRSSPMVDHGLSALALAVYSRTQQDPAAATEGSAKYHRLLQLIQERIVEAEISSLDRPSIDSCLLTIFLMSRYESSIHHPGKESPKASFGSLQSWSHFDGAMVILKLWHDDWRSTGPSPIARQTRRGSIKSLLLRNIEMPDWMVDGEKFDEHGLELGYDRIYVRVVKMHHAALALEQHEHPCITKIENLDREGHEILSALQEWKEQFPNTCFYRKLTLPGGSTRSRKHFYASTVYAYSSVIDASLWCQYFAMTVLLLNTVWRVLKLLRSDLAWKEQLLKRAPLLNNTADSLAFSIPFCLERFKVSNFETPDPLSTHISISKEDVKPYLAGLVVWPLTVASSLQGISEEHRQFFRSELEDLGRVTGDGGLECAMTEQWVKL